MKTIVLTGGGTAGHVTPNLALLPGLEAEGYTVHYIGSETGIEKELALKAGIFYHHIATGKMRRYLNAKSLGKNFTDLFRVVKGAGEARAALKKIKPDLLFSKGGFVSVPVTAAARTLGIPVVIHESDLTPGLANRLSFPFARAICASFPETMERLPARKAVLTGAPIRRELFSGDRIKGAAYCGFNGKKPVLMMTGGSSGSAALNGCLRDALDDLLPDFDIVHLCGKGHVDEAKSRPGYLQFAYVKDELKDLFALCDLVVSRAGANTVCELAALRKPHLLIPLSRRASRGDQIANADSFAKQGFSLVLAEEELTAATLSARIRGLYRDRERYRSAMEQNPLADGTRNVLDVIGKNMA